MLRGGCGDAGEAKNLGDGSASGDRGSLAHSLVVITGASQGDGFPLSDWMEGLWAGGRVRRKEGGRREGGRREGGGGTRSQKRRSER